MEDISRAVCDLYGSWEPIPAQSVTFIQQALKNGNYEKALQDVRDAEDCAKTLLVQFETDYPKVANMENANTIIEKLKQKKNG